VGGHNHGLASGQVMSGSNVARAPALLQELLDHAQRDTKAPGNFDPRLLGLVIRIENTLAEIQGKRAHGPTLPDSTQKGYIIY